MSRTLRIGAYLLAIAALVAGSGFVMVRVARMSLFLEARDLLARGRDPEVVLGHVARRIDWPPVGRREAVAIAAAATGRTYDPGRIAVYRAGDWALLESRSAPLELLLVRTRKGWRQAP